MIQLDRVYFSYREGRQRKPVLVDLSFFIGRGRFVAVLGPNGSGKSTLLKLIRGLISPDSGSIKVNGLSVSTADGAAYLRQKVGYILEQPDIQIFSPVVEEDILLSLESDGVTVDEARKRIDQVSRLLDIEHLLKKPIEKLSSGEVQRVAVAGVLVREPEIILSDESTSWLDSYHAQFIVGLFKKLAEQGRTVVHVTHTPAEAVQADEVIVLKDGRIFRQGTPAQVFTSAYELVKAGVKAPLSALITQYAREAGVDVHHPALTPGEI